MSRILKNTLFGMYFTAFLAVIVMFILGFMSNDKVGMWCLNHMAYLFAAFFVLLCLMPIVTDE
jgi:uncharacterized membrane protein